MSIFASTKTIFAYRIWRAAVKTGHTTDVFHGIMNLRGLF
jgi:hypothetical protein